MKPQPGPQTLFATSTADVCFFASMPGSGKSYSLCMEALRWVHLPKYTGVLMRANFKELVRGPTSLFGTLSHLGSQMGYKIRQAPYPEVYQPGAGSVLCMHGNTELSTFDGIELAMLGLDEAAHFSQELFSYLSASRLRSTSGIRPYVRCSVMPSADTWVHNLVKPWLEPGPKGYADPAQSGVVRWFYYDNRGLPVFFDDRESALESAKAVDALLKPRSLSFVFAKTQDNLALMSQDPEYVDRLAQLPPHERERLLYGSWEARPSSSGMFDRSKWNVLDQAPLPKTIVESVRGWDLAATKPSDENHDPDWTRGARLDRMPDGQIVVSDMVSLRDRPGPVDDLLSAVAKADGPKVTQAFATDPGSGGVRDEQHIRAVLAKVPGCGPVKFQRAANKEALAKVWSSLLSAGRMSIVRASWNGPFMSELDVFPSMKKADHDDQVDAVSYAFRELHLADQVVGPGHTLLASMGRLF